MGKNIAIVVLAIVVLVSSALTTYTSLRVASLESSLNEYVVALEETRGILEQTIAQYEQTKAQFVNTQYQLDETRTQLRLTETQADTLEQLNKQLEEIAEVNKLFFYYTLGTTVERQYSLTVLEQSLSRWHWKEDVYKINLFDCSEMSALWECRLENEGFHTVIVAGSTPDESGGRHAWLLVEVSPGEYMPVEATRSSVVYWRSHHFNNYFKYDYIFEDIHEAMAYSSAEFDWWR